uniref:Uncharacterized protein n=1 Tax=Eutreptiella gymnastica TaxID=73025 RepID=A0A7S4G2Y7_9EUGL|mmetsp:Transcript_45087/g.73530  ORF Transcript_45087/g.73530 Transcript_45087/m.73530 type:complete len:105 (+) Transcript_45087:156-470(+)
MISGPTTASMWLPSPKSASEDPTHVHAITVREGARQWTILAPTNAHVGGVDMETPGPTRPMSCGWEACFLMARLVPVYRRLPVACVCIVRARSTPGEGIAAAAL